MSETVGKYDIRRIAGEMLSGQLGILEGCRAMVLAIHYADVQDEEVFLFFRGVESELDDIPQANQRHRWEPAALARKDAEAQAYIDEIKGEILDACREIIRCGRW